MKINVSKLLILLLLFVISKADNDGTFPVYHEIQDIPNVERNQVWKDCKGTFPSCYPGTLIISTVCQLKNCNVRGKNCYENPSNKAFRQGMVDIHNQVRNMVAEGKNETLLKYGITSAANMRAVSYDLALEYLCTCVTHNCRMGHTICSSIGNNQYLGQNLGYYSSTDLSKNFKSVEFYKAMAFDWYDSERDVIEDYTKIIDSYRSVKEEDLLNKSGSVRTVGHFTQFLWASISRIGCATVYEKWAGYNQKPNDRERQTMHLCCSYGTDYTKYIPGNTLTYKVYQRGEAASNCSMYEETRNKKYPYLCGEIDNTDIVDDFNPWRKKELDILREGRVPSFGIQMQMNDVLFLTMLIMIFKL